MSVLGDFNDLLFPQNSFDGVWSYTSFLHVPKLEVKTALAETHRVLKKEGILGLGLIEGDTEGYRESLGVNSSRYFAYYKKEEIEDLLKETGFTPFYFETFKPRTKNYLHFLARRN